MPLNSSCLRPAIMVAGPTASGKSALALRIAQQMGGVVINADSMQIYDVLRVVTARPDDRDLAAVPHRLYGVMSPACLCSAAQWRDLAIAEMDKAWEQGLLPVVVGGTGLYLRTLMDGISPIPEIPDSVRQQARQDLAEMGNAAFHQRLMQHDPQMGQRLPAGDSQRMVRAWEVLQATGQSLAHWQTLPMEGAVQARWLPFVLDPPRPVLNQRCDQRFEQMVQQGALAEVEALLKMQLDPALPAMKALGVPELAAFLAGRCSLEQAITDACLSTRQYAKRQGTWFRNQLAPTVISADLWPLAAAIEAAAKGADAPARRGNIQRSMELTVGIRSSNILSAQFSERDFDQIFSFIRQFLLTPA